VARWGDCLGKAGRGGGVSTPSCQSVVANVSWRLVGREAGSLARVVILCSTFARVL
jgi:hypothetical protein